LQLLDATPRHATEKATSFSTGSGLVQDTSNPNSFDLRRTSEV